MSHTKVLALSLTLCALGCGSEIDADPDPGSGFDIDEESLFGSGGLTLTGTITLSTSVSPGTAAQVGLISGTSVPSLPWFGNEIFGGRSAQGGTSLRFRVTNLDADELRIFARVDASGDSMFGSGDLGGYHAGMATSPVQDPAASTAVQPGQDLAFGVAPIP
jgi:hypothetical protein